MPLGVFMRVVSNIEYGGGKISAIANFVGYTEFDEAIIPFLYDDLEARIRVSRTGFSRHFTFRGILCV
jgi:hypothetical protein